MLTLEILRAFDRIVRIDVSDDLLDHRIVVPKVRKRPWDDVVDNLHVPAADELLILHQRNIRLDSGCVAVHDKRDRPGRGNDGYLGVAQSVPAPVLDNAIPHLAGDSHEF